MDGDVLGYDPGGAICPHCGFELDEPEEGTVLAFRKAGGRPEGGFWMTDDQPEDVFDEAA